MPRPCRLAPAVQWAAGPPPARPPAPLPGSVGREAGRGTASTRRPPHGCVAAGQAGQATVELALLVPLLALAVLAVVQVGLVMRDQIAVVHAAREAARVAAVDPDPARAVEAARRVVSGAEVDVGRRPAVGEPLRVEVRYRAVTRLPLVGPLVPDPVLTSSAVMRVER